MSAADAIRARRAAIARADAIRSLMPLCDIEEAVATIVERKRIEADRRREPRRSSC